MKILQAIAGGDVGGAEEFFVRLAAAFQRRGLEQRIVARPNEMRGKKLEDADISPLELAFGGFFDRQTVPALAAEIDRFMPDILLSWMSRGTSMAGKAVERASCAPVLIGRLGGYYDLKYYARCDHLIGNTPDIVRHLVDRGWPSDRAHFVPNFVSPTSGTALSRDAFGIPETAPIVLAAGRLHRNKAFDILLRALKTAESTYLLLAGDGADARDLEVMAHKLGVADRVRFLGWRSDMADLMATADMLACPSRIEPLGNVVLEAWARELPVVAAASDGPGWLISDGEDGLLVPVEDAEGLGAAISRLAEDKELAAALAIAGRRKFAAGFTEDAVVEKFIDLFDKVRG